MSFTSRPNIPPDRYFFKITSSYGSLAQDRISENLQSATEDVSTSRPLFRTLHSNAFCLPATGDCDGDGIADANDIDEDGDGLIEIHNQHMLHNIRYVLDGSGYATDENATKQTNGCQNGACTGYELTTNIALTAEWQPIAHNQCNANGMLLPDANVFRATFDGNGHSISGLSINQQNQSCLGLFGAVSDDTTIRNLRLNINQIKGASTIGSIVGHGNPTIIDSSAHFNLIQGNNNIGGLIGHGDRANILSSFIQGNNISGNSNIGGLIGQGNHASIRTSYAQMHNLTATGNNIGGLIGNAPNGQITSAYAQLETITGEENVGGLIGQAQQARLSATYAQSKSLRATQKSWRTRRKHQRYNRYPTLLLEQPNPSQRRNHCRYLQQHYRTHLCRTT